MVRHFIDLFDINALEAAGLLDRASALKREDRRGETAAGAQAESGQARRGRRGAGERARAVAGGRPVRGLDVGERREQAR